MKRSALRATARQPGGDQLVEIDLGHPGPARARPSPPRTAATRSRSRAGSTWSSLASADRARTLGAGGATRGRPQAERHRHRFVVVEHQGGRWPASTQGVAAVSTGGGLHRVPEVAQDA